jgi:hypothetical protein
MNSTFISDDEYSYSRFALLFLLQLYPDKFGIIGMLARKLRMIADNCLQMGIRAQKEKNGAYNVPRNPGTSRITVITWMPAPQWHSIS